MSADNAIIIFHGDDGYGVKHIQNIERLYHHDGSLNVREILVLFKAAEKFENLNVAEIYADHLQDEIGLVEYGIIKIGCNSEKDSV